MARTRTSRKRATPFDPDRWYTVAEVAAHYALSARSIRRLIAEGELQALTASVGAQRPTYRISGAALNRYEERNAS